MANSGGDPSCSCIASHGHTGQHKDKTAENVSPWHATVATANRHHKAKARSANVSLCCQVKSLTVGLS